MAAAPVLPTSPAPTPDSAPLSEGARIINTFIAPSKTFTDLRRNASWWGPWILISIFSLVFVYAMGKQVGFEQISKNQVAHSSRADQFDKLPADQQAKQLQLSSKIIGFFSYGSPLLILFYVLIETVVLWLTFKLAAGAETSFKTAYAISLLTADCPESLGPSWGPFPCSQASVPKGSTSTILSAPILPTIWIRRRPGNFCAEWHHRLTC